MRTRIYLALAAAMLTLTACAGSNSSGDAPSLTIYSGRTEELVGPLIEQFQQESGIEAHVRYGGNFGNGATILEEGDNSPADVFYGQDAGALGALAAEGHLEPLPQQILDNVAPRFRSPDGLWVGTSGRARVVAYNTNNIQPEDLPDSIMDFTDPAWQGRIGWPPTNGSFQAFVTAMRLTEGEEATRTWLEGIIANEPVAYPKNSVALAGVAAGEVDVAFVNHYYLFRALQEEGESFAARNYYLPGGDAGALINVAGAGIITTTKNRDAAQQFIAFLLSPDAQQYFADETFEYPLVEGIQIDPRLPPLASINTPDIDLSGLADLQATLELLQEVGALEYLWSQIAQHYAR